MACCPVSPDAGACLLSWPYLLSGVGSCSCQSGPPLSFCCLGPTAGAPDAVRAGLMAGQEVLAGPATVGLVFDVSRVVIVVAGIATCDATFRGVEPGVPQPERTSRRPSVT